MSDCSRHPAGDGPYWCQDCHGVHEIGTIAAGAARGPLAEELEPDGTVSLEEFLGAPSVAGGRGDENRGARRHLEEPDDVLAVTPKELEPTDVAAAHAALDEAAYAVASAEREELPAMPPASVTILEGDALELLSTLPAESIDCAVTSPPYYGLRAYGGPSTLGREPTVAEYVTNLTAILRELRRVLKPTGSLWVNLGETYRDKRALLIPDRLAIALADDGWVIRNEITWEKTNVRPESAKDRLTNATERILFLTVRPADYFFSPAPLREPAEWNFYGAQTSPKARTRQTGSSWQSERPDRRAELAAGGTRHPRNVWSFPGENKPNNGLAPFPEELPRRCLQLGCPPGGVVLDPFAGSGTTLVVARELELDYIGIDSDPHAIAEMRRRGL